MPGSRGMVAGATAADVRDILVEGESGFLALKKDPPKYEPSKSRLTWPNGSIALLRSADEPERFRGPQQHWAIADEWCSWRYPAAWDMLMLGLRLGKDPRCVVATTPKPTKLLRTLMVDSTTVITRGSTYDNRDNLAPPFFEQIIRRYEGTRLGRQELNAEVIEDVEGALWRRAMLDENRVAAAPPLLRVVIGVDPKASVEADSETGIVAVGLAEDGAIYVVDDVSLNGSPEQWARAVMAAFHRNEADRVIVEVNQGGDMVTSVLRIVPDGAGLPISEVRATRGKYLRAEPIAALYEQGRVRHVGMFAKLEDQMCNWTPGDASPDRLDALVWAITGIQGPAATGLVDFA